MLADLCLFLTASKNQPVKSELPMTLAGQFLKKAPQLLPRRSVAKKTRSRANYTTISATIPRLNVHALCGLSGLSVVVPITFARFGKKY